MILYQSFYSKNLNKPSFLCCNICLDKEHMVKVRWFREDLCYPWFSQKTNKQIRFYYYKEFICPLFGRIKETRKFFQSCHDYLFGLFFQNWASFSHKFWNSELKILILTSLKKIHEDFKVFVAFRIWPILMGKTRLPYNLS